MSKCCFDIRAVRISSFKMLFWHILTFELSHYYAWRFFFDYSTRAVLTFELSPNSKFYMPKCYFDIFWYSSWVIFRHYSTRGYLSFSAKKPIFDFVWDWDKNHCLGTYMFCLGWIFMKRADNQNRDTVLDVFDCEPDQTFHYRGICPRVPKAYIRHCQFSFNQILWTWLAGNQGVCDEFVTRHAYLFVTPVKNSHEFCTCVTNTFECFTRVTDSFDFQIRANLSHVWRIRTNYSYVWQIRSSFSHV